MARWYCALEHLGMGVALARRRWEFLADFAGSRSGRVLLLGDGDGRFLAALLAASSAVNVDAVDSSSEMLRLARRRVIAAIGQDEAQRRARFHHADATEWSPLPDARYNAVCTHFFLDCLTTEQIEALLARLTPALAPDVTWIVSEFHQPPSGIAACRARIWIASLYRLFGWTTGLRVRRLPDYRAVLAAHGFRLEKEVQSNLGLLVSERWRRTSAGFYD